MLDDDSLAEIFARCETPAARAVCRDWRRAHDDRLGDDLAPLLRACATLRYPAASARMRMVRRYGARECPVPLYTCARCGRAASEILGCRGCRRAAARFPWARAAAGPIAAVALAVVLSTRI